MPNRKVWIDTKKPVVIMELQEQPVKKLRFSPLPSSPTKAPGSGGGGGGGGGGQRKFGEKAQKKRSLLSVLKTFNVWEWSAFGLLSGATLLFFIAFLTNGWGKIIVENTAGSAGQKGYNATDGEFWEFGLWQCCRNDGFCLVSRWPPFYIATRTFSCLALIGQLVCLTWYIGHSLEKILLYDVCAYSCIISFMWFTGTCLLVAVSVFGSRWPREFAHEFHGTSVSLDYAFYFAAVACPMTFAAGAMVLVHMIKTRDYFLSLKTDLESYVTAEELLGTDEEGKVVNI